MHMILLSRDRSRPTFHTVRLHFHNQTISL